MEANVSSDTVMLSLGIVVNRADGTTEDLGTVAYWHRDPEKMKEWEESQSKEEAEQ